MGNRLNITLPYTLNGLKYSMYDTLRRFYGAFFEIAGINHNAGLIVLCQMITTKTSSKIPFPFFILQRT